MVQPNKDIDLKYGFELIYNLIYFICGIMIVKLSIAMWIFLLTLGFGFISSGIFTICGELLFFWKLTKIPKQIKERYYERNVQETSTSRSTRRSKS